MLALLFFVAVGVAIGVVVASPLAYGVGHVGGMAEGYEQGCATAVDREVEAARRTWAASQHVVPCDPPPVDWERWEAAERAAADAEHSSTGEQTRWHGA